MPKLPPVHQQKVNLALNALNALRSDLERIKSSEDGGMDAHGQEISLMYDLVNAAEKVERAADVYTDCGESNLASNLTAYSKNMVDQSGTFRKAAEDPANPGPVHDSLITVMIAEATLRATRDKLGK